MAERVMIVDDDEAVLDSLLAVLLAEGLAAEGFASARELLDHQPGPVAGCVVTDVRMPDLDGLELIEALRARGPLPPVIVITGHGDVAMAVKAMKLGARDFIEKPFDPDLLVAAIRSCVAAAGRAPGSVDPDLGGRLASLTPRERQVMEQLVVGQSNKAIGRALDISPRTVEIHRARVMEKMHAASLSQLVRMALAAGIDPAPSPVDRSPAA